MDMREPPEPRSKAPEGREDAVQVTPSGHKIPMPKRREVLDFFKSVTGKRPLSDGGSREQ